MATSLKIYRTNIWVGRILAVIGIILILWTVLGKAACAALSGGGYELTNESVSQSNGILSGGVLTMSVQQPVTYGVFASTGPATVSTPSGGVIIPNSNGTGYTNAGTETTSTPNASRNIYNVQIRFVSQTQAYITFDSTEPGKSSVVYKSSSGVEGSTGLTPAYDFSHTATLSGLTPSTNYTFQIYVRWVDGTTTAFNNATYNFQTLGIQKTQTQTPASPHPSQPSTSQQPSQPSKTNPQAPTQPAANTEDPNDATPTDLQAKAVAKDKIDLAWKNPTSDSFKEVIVVRSDVNFPTTKDEGVVVYQGTAQNFSDVSGVDTTKPYYYTLFGVTKSNKVSLGIPSKSNTLEQEQSLVDIKPSESEAQNVLVEEDRTLQTPSCDAPQPFYYRPFFWIGVLLLIIGLLLWITFSYYYRKNTENENNLIPQT